MAAAIPVLFLAGAAVQAYGAVQQANAAQTAASYNATIRERDASVAMDQATRDAQQVQRQVKQAQGTLLAGYGAAGVVSNEGSPLDVLAMSARNGKLDEENILYRGRLKAMGAMTDAELNRISGQTAKEQGNLNAASYLLTGIGRGASTYAAGQRPLRQTYGGYGYGGYAIGED